MASPAPGRGVCGRRGGSGDGARLPRPGERRRGHHVRQERHRGRHRHHPRQPGPLHGARLVAGGPAAPLGLPGRDRRLCLALVEARPEEPGHLGLRHHDGGLEPRARPQVRRPARAPGGHRPRLVGARLQLPLRTRRQLRRGIDGHRDHDLASAQDDSRQGRRLRRGRDGRPPHGARPSVPRSALPLGRHRGRPHGLGTGVGFVRRLPRLEPCPSHRSAGHPRGCGRRRRWPS
jgi:hypothetical protein